VSLRRAALAAALLAAVPSAVRAQSSPFVKEDVYQALRNELSGDRAFEYDRQLSHFHRTAGSRDFFKAAEVIRQAAVDAGMEDVRLVRQTWTGQSWSCTSAEAWLLDPPEKLASYGDVRVSVADHSRTTHLVAELVDVGPGVAEADYKGKDVKGKVVLASGQVASAQREAVWKRGALGVLSHMTQRPTPLDAPDQVAWGRLPYDARGVDGVKDGTPSTFAMMISPRRGQALQKTLAAATAPLKVKVDIESAYPDKGEQAYVEAWIKGSEVHDQQVVFTAHIQEEMTSANDDGSGCANLLEMGRTLSRLIKDGKLPRPKRDLRFWWVNELASEEQFFTENQKESRRMLVNVNQDMVGARQSLGGRVQYASRLPWSIPHALEDVTESVLTAVSQGNTTYLTHRGTAAPQPFTREITSIKGSREPFHAGMVPYHGSTDHHTFTPAPIGVPGVSLTNWPDEFIHSTGDDLDQVDATQLERNAMVATLVAWFFATAGEYEAATAAAYVASRGASRIAADLASGVAHVSRAAAADRPGAFRAARNLVRQSHRKEVLAVGSVRRLAGRGRAAEYITQATERLESTLGEDLRALERAYVALTGQNLPNVEPTREEEALDRQVYVPAPDFGTWFAALEKVKAVEGLHPVLRFEVYNFADGKRSALEVYEAVAAEALSAGEWYYGTVKAGDVKEALDRAVQAGAYTVRKK
jgi:hypothetical protein